MRPDQKLRLQLLIQALQHELERLEWEDREALEGGPIEIDGSLDYVINQDSFGRLTFSPIGEYAAHDLDGDFPDETDHAAWPLCVECGNFTPSCVC